MYIEKVYLNNEENLARLFKAINDIAKQYDIDCVGLNFDVQYNEEQIRVCVANKVDGSIICSLDFNDYEYVGYSVNESRQEDAYNIVLTANDWWCNTMIESLGNLKDRRRYIYERFMYFRDKADAQRDLAIKYWDEKYKQTIGALMDEYKELEEKIEAEEEKEAEEKNK